MTIPKTHLRLVLTTETRERATDLVDTYRRLERLTRDPDRSRTYGEQKKAITVALDLNDEAKTREAMMCDHWVDVLLSKPVPMPPSAPCSESQQHDRRELAERFAHQQSTRGGAIDEIADLLRPMPTPVSVMIGRDALRPSYMSPAEFQNLVQD